MDGYGGISGTARETNATEQVTIETLIKMADYANSTLSCVERGLSEKRNTLIGGPPEGLSRAEQGDRPVPTLYAILREVGSTCDRLQRLVDNL